jgi:hypothetical protein
MIDKLSIALGLAILLFLGYLLLRAYYPKVFGGSTKTVDTFNAGAKQAAPIPAPTLMNTPPPPSPAPAPIVKQEPPMEPRVVAPGGPAAPAAAAPPEMPATLSPDAAPLDPYHDSNMEAPIHDSLRYPERSFGPGVENTGTAQLNLSGVGSASASTQETPFSPDFAQNGASFMGTVFANDLSKDDRFAEA